MGGTHAIILAGGYGTRLLPLTARRPKHLLPVAGEPLITHQLRWLASAGVDEVVIATSYYAEQFSPVLGDGSGLGIRLQYAHEGEPLGTAGAIAHATAYLSLDVDDCVVVLNGDQISHHDLRIQLAHFDEARRLHDCVASIHTRVVEDARPFGLIEVGDDDRVVAFREKPTDRVAGAVNAGTYVVSPQLISTIPTDRSVSLERDTFPDVLSGGAHVVAHRQDCYCLDVGTPDALVQASRDAVMAAGQQSIVRGDTTIHPRAQIGDGSFIDSGVTIARDADVSGSIVMRDAHIGAGAVITDSVVGPGAVVGASVVMQQAAVGDDARIDDHVILRPGDRVDVDEHVESRG